MEGIVARGGVTGEVRCLRFRKVHSRRWRGERVAPAFAGIGGLTLAVEWALPELEFEDVRGFVGEPLRNGEEPAECGSVRRFGGDFAYVDIGEFETPDGGSGEE